MLAPSTWKQDSLSNDIISHHEAHGKREKGRESKQRRERERERAIERER